MAKVEGLKEKLHFPLYDAFFVPPPLDLANPQTLGDSLTDPRVIRFFVDVQNKTKLETNMQAAGTLPSQNSYDARSLRVVVSNLVQRKEDKPEKLKDSDHRGRVRRGLDLQLRHHAAGRREDDDRDAHLRLSVRGRRLLGLSSRRDQRDPQSAGGLPVRRARDDRARSRTSASRCNSRGMFPGPSPRPSGPCVCGSCSTATWCGTFSNW